MRLQENMPPSQLNSSTATTIYIKMVEKVLGNKCPVISTVIEDDKTLDKFAVP